jgi:hypothetical protein
MRIIGNVYGFFQEKASIQHEALLQQLQETKEKVDKSPVIPNS